MFFKKLAPTFFSKREPVSEKNAHRFVEHNLIGRTSVVGAENITAGVPFPGPGVVVWLSLLSSVFYLYFFCEKNKNYKIVFLEKMEARPIGIGQAARTQNIPNAAKVVVLSRFWCCASYVSRFCASWSTKQPPATRACAIFYRKNAPKNRQRSAARTLFQGFMSLLALRCCATDRARTRVLSEAPAGPASRVHG